MYTVFYSGADFVIVLFRSSDCRLFKRDISSVYGNLIAIFEACTLKYVHQQINTYPHNAIIEKSQRFS